MGNCSLWPLAMVNWPGIPPTPISSPTHPLLPFIIVLADFRSTFDPPCNGAAHSPTASHEVLLGRLPEPDAYYASLGLRHTESYYQSPCGRIFTHSFHPVSAAHDGDVKGAVFMTHGYCNDSSWLFQTVAISYARWGYAVFCADLLGHGRSDGIHGYVGDMESVARASLSFFLSVRKGPVYASLPAFLLGESMGGAAALHLYPSRVRLFLYGLLLGLADTWAVLPDKRVGGKFKPKSNRDPEKMKVIASNRGATTARRGWARCGAGPRHGAAQGELWGGDGAVPGAARHRRRGHRARGPRCCTSARRARTSRSSCTRGCTTPPPGESDENRDRVFADMRTWIDERVRRYSAAVPAANDDTKEVTMA
ncbi:hypothetical protein QYE76_021490 [Lolium multiflorum]|uniref:Serine aminopeptidase S33 domain-containing protein n=1 Tax=Lolium multiflorum TaxID=4521 RepID=A0AAD8RAX6_LOLMU|nr:hypothetical protein QYE76_021490 [Lolium multiflorum]